MAVKMGAVTRQLRSSLEQQARAGDRLALGELLRAHDRAMRSIAWKMLGDAELVDDVLQDAYLKAYRSIARFRGDAQFQTWLHRIVANTAVDHLRRLSGRREVPIDHYPNLAIAADDDRISDSERVRQALLALPDDQRLAVLLVDCEGYSYDEAADVLGITTGAVGSHLFRARSRLQAMGERS